MAAERDLEHARADLHYAIRAMHAAGGSMRAIAQAVGLSHQRVHQIIEGGETPPRKAGLLKRLTGRTECETVDNAVAEHLFDRTSPDARRAIVRAQDEARALGHNYLGTEHVLLGLIDTESGLAPRLLAREGVSREQARTALENIVGAPATPIPSTGALALMPRVKRVLELARDEARRDHSPHVRGEHLLLGICREGKGVGAAILAQAGIGYDDVRRRLNRAGLECSFCGRDGVDVDHLIAGPGMHICERCTATGSQLAAGSGTISSGAGLTLTADSTCGFCGRTSDGLVAGLRATICGDCLALCREIHAEREGRPLG